jgi:AcrR family transcriptional regulator
MLSPRTRKRGEARAKIVAAATEVFNEVGYAGTDSNALARAAGYAPATFYRYFTSKLHLFLEIFRNVVRDEWSQLEATPPTRTRLRAMIRVLIGYHGHWAGLRRSMRGLALADPDARAAFWERRSEQIERLLALAQAGGVDLGRPRAAATIVVLAALADAAADGELAHYGLSNGEIEQVMVDLALGFGAPGGDLEPHEK